MTCDISSSLSRTSLCRALTTAAATQDKSPVLLETLMSSLLVSFSSNQVTTSVGRAACSKILVKISSLAGRGYLGDSPDTLQLLADLVSSYTALNDVNSSLITPSKTRYPVDYAVSNVLSSCTFYEEGVALALFAPPF